MTSEIRGYLLGGCQSGAGLEINGGISHVDKLNQVDISMLLSPYYYALFHCVHGCGCAHSGRHISYTSHKAILSFREKTEAKVL